MHLQGKFLEGSDSFINFNIKSLYFFFLDENKPLSIFVTKFLALSLSTFDALGALDILICFQIWIALMFQLFLLENIRLKKTSFCSISLISGTHYNRESRLRSHKMIKARIFTHP